MLVFSAPKLNAYDFMCRLCAALAKTKNVIVDRTTFVENIYNFKKQADPELSYMFDDIEFRESINSVVSYDINEGLINLQTLGAIGKLNPSCEKIVIYFTEQEADEILSDCDAQEKEAMLELAHMINKVNK